MRYNKELATELLQGRKEQPWSQPGDVEVLTDEDTHSTTNRHVQRMGEEAVVWCMSCANAEGRNSPVCTHTALMKV